MEKLTRREHVELTQLKMFVRENPNITDDQIKDLKCSISKEIDNYYSNLKIEQEKKLIKMIKNNEIIDEDDETTFCWVCGKKLTLVDNKFLQCSCITADLEDNSEDYENEQNGNQTLTLVK